MVKTVLYRVCVCCEKPFTPGVRDWFMCQACKKEIREEARQIRERSRNALATTPEQRQLREDMAQMVNDIFDRRPDQ